MQGMCSARKSLKLFLILSQICDFDLCDTCMQQAIESPPLTRHASPRVLLAATTATILVSSDDSPPHQKVHPFFIRRERREKQMAEETHFMRFYATASLPASTAPPPNRATGRLRLRVSTPLMPPQVVRTALAPRRQLGRMRLSPPCCLSPLQYEMAGLAISTPPRVGYPEFQPRLLFPDSPLPSPIVFAGNSPASRRVVQSCDAGVQTRPFHDVPTQPSVAVQTDELPDAAAPLSVQHFQHELQLLRNELRVLVMGFGF